jgi:hypothetical protein
MSFHRLLSRLILLCLRPLRDHPVICLVQYPGWPPGEFTDESGERSGTAGDYLSLVEQRQGRTTHYSVVPASIKDNK